MGGAAISPLPAPPLLAPIGPSMARSQSKDVTSSGTSTIPHLLAPLPSTWTMARKIDSKGTVSHFAKYPVSETVAMRVGCAWNIHSQKFDGMGYGVDFSL